MHWHVTIETPTDVYEFDVPCKTPGEAFIPLLRRMDVLGISQNDVVLINMELRDDGN